MDHHSEDFERMKADLHEKGYQEKDVTITSGEAMVLGALYGMQHTGYRVLRNQRKGLRDGSKRRLYNIRHGNIVHTDDREIFGDT